MTSLRPGTRLGRWSLLLLLAFVAALGGLFLAISLGERGGDTIASNWWLGAPGLTAAGSGIGAFVVGLIALVRGERALSVFLATAVGLLVTLFVTAEVAFPH